MPRVPTVIPEPMLARLTDRLSIGATWSRTLSAHRALVDGEIVALGGEGRPPFQALQHRGGRSQFLKDYFLPLFGGVE